MLANLNNGYLHPEINHTVTLARHLFNSCLKDDLQCAKAFLDAGVDQFAFYNSTAYRKTLRPIDMGCYGLFLEQGHNLMQPIQGLDYTADYMKALVLLLDHDVICNGTEHLNELSTYEDAAYIHILLESGIDFDSLFPAIAQNIKNIAVLCGNADVLLMLMDRMSNDTIKPSVTSSIIMRLLQNEEEDKAIAVIQEYPPKKDQGHRWLRAAAYHNCIAFVKFLLDHYAMEVDDIDPSYLFQLYSPPQQEIEVMTALSIAVRRGNNVIACRLVAERADVNLRYIIPSEPMNVDDNGRVYKQNNYHHKRTDVPSGVMKLTLLMISCAHGKLDEVKLLLSLGANVNLQDELQGDTALHYALQLRYDFCYGVSLGRKQFSKHFITTKKKQSEQRQAMIARL